MTKLARFLIYSAQDTYVRVEGQPLMFKIIVILDVLVAHFLTKGLHVPERIVITICFGR